jgi:hypothetical protein
MVKHTRIIEEYERGIHHHEEHEGHEGMNCPAASYGVSKEYIFPPHLNPLPPGERKIRKPLSLMRGNIKLKQDLSLWSI